MWIVDAYQKCIFLNVFISNLKNGIHLEIRHSKLLAGLIFWILSATPVVGMADVTGMLDRLAGVCTPESISLLLARWRLLQRCTVLP